MRQGYQEKVMIMHQVIFILQETQQLQTLPLVYQVEQRLTPL